ncbi:UDP-glucose dehydrogenase family protein [Intestinibacter sp.]
MNISIAGTGYVGLVTAVCLAEKGNHVTCVDINKTKIELLNNGVSPIYEPELEALMNKNHDKLVFTDDYEFAYKNAEIIFIGVGTPEKIDGSASLKYVYEVAQQICDTIENDCIIIIKSTVPIGTNDKIEKFIRDNLKNKVNVWVVSNPEFLAQGSAVKDTLYPSRIVIGCDIEEVAAKVKSIYENFDAPVLITKRRSAEMIKYASNDFLALKISYINEIANLCEIIGADIDEVSLGMGFDERIGNKFLKAGIGYGGSCFPKDTKALYWLSNFNDCEIKTIKATIEVNEQQKLKLIKKARKYIDSFEGMQVAILGVAFKPNTDDLRESPILDNIPILLEDGAKIKVWDPVAMKHLKNIYGNQIEYCNSLDDALQGANICFIFTEWKDIKKLTIDDFYKNMNTIKVLNKSLILDGRNCFNVKDMIKENIIYESIGRSVAEEL